MEFPKERFGAAIKARRKEMRVTQAKLAEAVGIETRSWQQIEAGRQLPSVSLFYRIVRTMNLSVDSIFFDQPEESETCAAIVRRLPECDERDLFILRATLDAMLAKK